MTDLIWLTSETPAREFLRVTPSGVLVLGEALDTDEEFRKNLVGAAEVPGSIEVDQAGVRFVIDGCPVPICGHDGKLRAHGQTADLETFVAALYSWVSYTLEPSAS